MLIDAIHVPVLIKRYYIIQRSKVINGINEQLKVSTLLKRSSYNRPLYVYCLSNAIKMETTHDFNRDLASWRADITFYVSSP